jgi:glycosyltransferase involved in cell wall biosynthesis
MKIVFDHQIFCSQEYGGISRYIYELSKHLSTTCRQDVAVITPFYVNQYLKYADRFVEIYGFPVKKFRRTGRLARIINWLVALPISRLLQPQIVHETYYSARSIAPKRAKVILTVHDMIHERFADEFSIFDVTSREKAIAVARADHIICISDQTRQDLIEILAVKPEKISVVYHGFSLTSNKVPFKKLKGFMRPFFLYVGVRNGYKNFEKLLDAFAKSIILKKDIDIVCFGGGAFASNELVLLKSLGLTLENVRQVSGSDEKLAIYYQSAIAFVYPSLYEGFGIPPLEAMSYDCPVVCSNVSSIPEVVSDAGLMFDPYSTESIMLALEQIVSDESLRIDLINRGRERIKEFSWHRCAKETLDVYLKVVK